ncbi:hypothetical protein AALC75_09165 [Lachnospiraceae bacterium 48-42]|nr:hypothetical protein [Dorea sp.]
MQVERLYAMVKALDRNDKITWKNEILLSMNRKEEIPDVSLEAIVLSAYSCFNSMYYIPGLKVTAYGAGKMAQRYIPEMSDQTKFHEIWDAYSEKKEVAGIRVIRPETEQKNYEAPIVVFIDDKVSRNQVTSLYRNKGYKNIFYFRDYMALLEEFSVIGNLEKNVTEKTKNIIDSLYSEYVIIENAYPPVLFTILNKNLMKHQIQTRMQKSDVEVLKERLSERITADKIPEEVWQESIPAFLHTEWKNKFELAYSFEIILQRLLFNQVKTVERPLRMLNDRPYDEFAVTVVVRELVLTLFEGYRSALDIIRSFRMISSESVPLMGAEVYLLLKCGEFTQALEVARQAMKKEPNGLLANESFFQAARECKKQGIHVEEPIPEYNLSEYFCWSGLNFVWCGGFNGQTGRADFSPCFRPLQCAARPEGEFWEGDDWKEFRRSVTDGSFKYCQKNQCANIVGGWLPRKSDCKEEWLKKLLDGDMSVVPPIEELHFSYDGHCNLKCPSCRLEIQTNSKAQNEMLDNLYEKNLKPYMKQAKHLTLSGCGEAMISPHSRKILQSFSKEEYPELSVELRTNATTVNASSWNALGTGKEVIRHITVSIDASTKDMFEKLRYPAKWETVLRNLEFIQSLRDAGEIDLFEFHVVIQTENINQLCDITKMAIRYSADAVTFSRLINWREMSEEEYHEINPFWYDNPLHEKLTQELRALEELRNDIENDNCDLTRGRKKIYINIHFSPDPNQTYDEIRTGRLKIR